jgi:hypothetical protein
VAAEVGSVEETEPVAAEVDSVEEIDAFEVHIEPELLNLEGEAPQFHRPGGPAPGGQAWWAMVGFQEDPVLGLRCRIEVHRGYV